MTTRNAVNRIDLQDLRFVGSGLNRPECVLACADGSLYSADWRGGVAHRRADGTVALFTAALPENRPLRPNGIALLQDGSFLLADLGEHVGGVFRLQRNGSVSPFLESVDGIELPPSNFVAVDQLGRTWITVSTRRQPRAAAYRSNTMGRAQLDRVSGARLKNISSMAFGGPDLRTAYLGCLLGDSIAYFRSPIAGHPPVHWHWGRP